jgi:hypothetical protein
MQVAPEMERIANMIRISAEMSMYIAGLDENQPDYLHWKATLEQQQAVHDQHLEHATAAYYKKKAADEARADIPASEPDFRERRKQFDERARAYRSQQKQTLAAAKAAAAQEEAEYVFVQEPDLEEDYVLV